MMLERDWDGQETSEGGTDCDLYPDLNAKWHQIPQCTIFDQGLQGSEVVTVLGVCCHLGHLPVLLSDNSQSTPDW